MRLGYGDRGTETRDYLLVEFEDAKASSIFSSAGPRALPEWGKRLEHGFGQIVDWFYIMNDLRRTVQMERAFGAAEVQGHGLLVIGRSRFLDATARKRLDWRFQRLVVDSQKVYCVTFDQLFEDLDRKLRLLSLP